jgi:hypothetical protein
MEDVISEVAINGLNDEVRSGGVAKSESGEE